MEAHSLTLIISWWGVSHRTKYEWRASGPCVAMIKFSNYFLTCFLQIYNKQAYFKSSRFKMNSLFFSSLVLLGCPGSPLII